MKLKIAGEETDERIVLLKLEQQDDGVVVKTKDNWTLVKFHDDGKLQLIRHIDKSSGFDVDSEGKLELKK